MRKLLTLSSFLISLLIVSTAIAVPIDDDFDQIYNALDEIKENLDVIKDNLDATRSSIKIIDMRSDAFKTAYEDEIKDVKGGYNDGNGEYNRLLVDEYNRLLEDTRFEDKYRHRNGSDAAVKRIKKDRIPKLKEDTIRLDEKVKKLKDDARYLSEVPEPTPTPTATPIPTPNLGISSNSGDKGIWWKCITITMIAITAGFGGFFLIKKRKGKEPRTGAGL